MKVSGAESVVAAASPFIGQGESAVLVKPFVTYLTVAEIHQIMTSGFATIAGSVMIAYIQLGVNPQALISSCVMSIPASLATSKLRYPEIEEPLTQGRVVIPESAEEDKAYNSLHAFANGAWLGIKIAGMIMASLLCIISFVGLVNALLAWWGWYYGISGSDGTGLTLEYIFGYLFYPIAILLGVTPSDAYLVAQLLGIKIVMNEFVAYTYLTDPSMPYSQMSPRSILIATYALCGFANFSSVGIQIGVLSQLAPTRASDIARVAFSALFTGAISTLTSASVAGILITNTAEYISQ